MKYRKFGNKDISVSPLGFGMMRLPLINKEKNSKVDEKLSIEMLRYAIDEGLNYVDTAYNYLEGQSEIITGKALLDGYREKVFLATKAPIWLYEDEEDFDKILDEQLNKLQSKSIDLYLLHGLNKNLWKDKVLKFNILDKMKKAKDKGKINNIGFSFHDDIKIFKEIIDYYPHWDFCQIQLNYLDTEFQAGIEGLKYAGSKGLGVIIIEPLRGGYLVNLPKKVQNT
ncbi:MAG: aldo/keto reductase, partial [Terrisporobacter sp.]|uniref:aldo/keto reductase n=1 Tax=Terrisporobacter sp. TaxID=1965305 RepID=UPI002FC64F1B